MIPSHVQAPPADVNTFVSSDIIALASHMSDCERSHGPFHELRVTLGQLRALAGAHIVTTGAVFGAVGLCLLLALN